MPSATLLLQLAAFTVWQVMLLDQFKAISDAITATGCLYSMAVLFGPFRWTSRGLRHLFLRILPLTAFCCLHRLCRSNSMIATTKTLAKWWRPVSRTNPSSTIVTANIICSLIKTVQATVDGRIVNPTELVCTREERASREASSPMQSVAGPQLPLGC